MIRKSGSAPSPDPPAAVDRSRPPVVDSSTVESFIFRRVISWFCFPRSRRCFSTCSKAVRNCLMSGTVPRVTPHSRFKNAFISRGALNALLNRKAGNSLLSRTCDSISPLAAYGCKTFPSFQLPRRRNAAERRGTRVRRRQQGAETHLGHTRPVWYDRVERERIARMELECPQ